MTQQEKMQKGAYDTKFW